MQNDNQWMKKYYNDEAQKLINERQHLWSPELQKKTEQDWANLIKDIEAAIAKGVSPEGPEGQVLAGRHNALVEGFTGGHAAIEEGLGKLWADFDNLPAEFKDKMQPFVNPKVTEFIDKAKAAGGQKS